MPHVEIAIGHVAGFGNARDVAQHGELAELAARGGNGSFPLVQVTHIKQAGRGTLAQLSGQVLRLFQLHIAQHHAAALGDNQPCDRSPDPLRAA